METFREREGWWSITATGMFLRCQLDRGLSGATGVVPQAHDPRVQLPDPGAEVSRAMDRFVGAVAEEVAAMPGHRDYLNREAARLSPQPDLTRA